MASRKCDNMMKCMPIVVAFSEKTISFKVNILNTKLGAKIYPLDGGGNIATADNIGEASLILKRATLPDEAQVLYFDGYMRRGEGDFCEETEKEIIKACIQTSKAIWE